MQIIYVRVGNRGRDPTAVRDCGVGEIAVAFVEEPCTVADLEDRRDLI